ncbi:MAG TPA: HAMP domain-containing sensor histidine kinase [Acidimicrobiales bacterium]|nr:HAMP domain-containing sensor histidine kinase [Acidimicrobiales bacterium]
MLALLVAGVVTTDLVTSSSLRSFLYGRLDEQIDAAQDTAYGYIEATYERALAADLHVATDNEEGWLAELAQPRTTTTPAPSPTVGRVPTTSDTIPTVVPTTLATGTSTAASARNVRGTRLNAEVLASRLSPDVYVEVIDGNGRILFQRPSGSSATKDPAPVLPLALPVQAAPPSIHFGTQHGAYVPDRPAFELATRGRGATYRAQAVAIPGGTLITAVPLDPTTQTLASLIHVEVIVSTLVVIALLLLALWIVRFGLRPLEEMTETAGAIAAGDLTRRIRRPDERGEVGRLGSALNGMMSQIEAAFAQRTASESRLRRFVADASHELRTPLTSIRGYAELLRKGALDDENARHRAAERIEHEAARMGLLVDDLLLLARLDQGRPLERTTVDLVGVVHDAVDAARAAGGDHTISLAASGVVLVSGDAARLRQVLDNLLRNAVVHTPPGTPVHVTVHRDGPRAVITVADEGPGLAEDQAVRLFDRFYRGSEARTGEGTGLGLSIVAALATAHGGRAFVHSVPGRGTVFTVELPSDPATGVAGDAGPGRVDAPVGGLTPHGGASDRADPAGGETYDTADHGHRPVRR